MKNKIIKQKNYYNKYIGKTFEGYKVVERKLKNNYNKSYAGKNTAQHRAYDYVLYNKKKDSTIIISGNQLRLINAGKRTIKDMFDNSARGSKNTIINQLKKQKRLSKLGKFVRDWTFKDFQTYCNIRACDGNWSLDIAITCMTLMQDRPKFRVKKWFQKNLNANNVFNIEAYPDLIIDIETGKVLHVK